uniref:GDSL esterase/lipase EXL3-like n=1 Tax=Nelumbo nucifera TaxID=4432 RepID=A0A822ZPD8_NELNU|nr:TPA_asm: hypothetical protein HUJ06_016694 [Nelumbo nucifera]
MAQIISPEFGLVSSATVIIVLSMVTYSLSLHIVQLQPKNETVPALLVFGDSIMDTGNNNYIVSLAKCNFSPYGRDFVGGIPTGRFSNGKVPSDFLAEGFGVKELLPPYLDPDLQTQDLITGVNFASGGAGYDPLTSQIETAISLSKQLKLFKEYIGKLKEAVGEERTATILSESIYIMCVGSNDVTINYFFAPFRRPNYDVSAFTDLLLQFASTFLQELYGLGARRIGVFNIPPIGCVPSQRTLAGGKHKDCVDNLNQAAEMFNAKLSSELISLTNKLSHSTLVYIDVYSSLLDIIQRPQDYGFEEISKGCCGTGKIEATILCNDLSPFTCKNASKYLFWDSFHPTEAGYKALFTIFMKNYFRKFFQS